MSDFTISKLTLALSFSVLISACANMGGESFNTPHNNYELSGVAELDNRQRADLYEAIITADLAEHQKDHQTAMSYYLFAADLSKDKQLIEKSVQSAQLAEDPLGMEQAAAVWLTIEPDSQEARTLILQAQIAQQNSSGALVTAKSLMQTIKSSEARYQLIENSVINQDPRLSFNLLRELNTQDPSEPAYETGLAKFIMNLSATNKQPSNMLNQALVRANEALKLNDEFIPAIRLKSHILYQLRRDDEARNFLSDVYNSDSKSAELSQMLGQLLYDLRDFDASAAHYTDWLRKNPDDQEARFYLAASNYALGEYELSLSDFVTLINNDYKVPTTAFYCGDASAKIEQYERAIECFDLVQEGRFWIHARLQLSKIYADHKDYDRALQTLQGSHSDDENDQIKLANAEIELLNNHFTPQAARERLDKALQEFPENLVLLLKKIELYDLTDKPNKLLPLLKQAREIFQPGAKLDEFNLAAAALLNNHGHSEMAIDWINSALETKPKDKDLLYTRAIYKEPLGLLKEMVEEFKYLHSLYPDDLNIQNALGYTLADQGLELDYAKSLIDAAFKGLPENPAVIDSMGWIAFRKGDLTKAIEYLTKAFKISPSADIAAHLGEVLWQDNKKELALKVLRKGHELDNKSEVLLKTLERLKIEL